MALFLRGAGGTERLGSSTVTWSYGPGLTLQGATVTHRHPGATYTFEYGFDPVNQPGQAQATVATGVNPGQIPLYGKVIPLSALGLARIGTAGLIWGPYFSGAIEARTASFAVSFGFPANVTGTRRVYEIALDGKVAWELAGGSPAGAIDAGGFISPAFTCRFYSGTQTQGADPLESAMFGAEAIAYRPQMMLWFENLPVAEFDNKVPFVSAKIGDVTDGAVPADGINLGEVLEQVAYSPWLEMAASFEAIGVADIVQAMILTEDQSFLDLLRVTASVYRTLDILQTDMLRVIDRGATVTPDLVLGRDHIAVDAGVQYSRQEEASVPRELELVTIDPDADYVFMPTKASRPRHPVPVTSSVGKETITLPVVIGATTRASLVTYAKYEEDNARKRIALRTMLYGYALEPGDLFRVHDVANGFDNGEVWKVVETSHGANFVNEISGEAILKCAFEEVSYDVVLLLHANSSSPLLDSSAYNETPAFVGGAYIDTTTKKFGAGSFFFDGVGDGVDVADGISNQYNFSPTNTSPYTIELWVKLGAISDVQHMSLLSQATFAQRAWVLYVPLETTELTFTTSSNGVSFATALSTSTANLGLTWHHVAVDKDSTGKVRIYVDGVMKASATPADSVIFNSSYPIGVARDAAGLYPFTGWIDDVRITSGSRYGDVYGNASFAVPSAEFPDDE